MNKLKSFYYDAPDMLSVHLFISPGAKTMSSKMTDELKKRNEKENVFFNYCETEKEITH